MKSLLAHQGNPDGTIRVSLIVQKKAIPYYPKVDFYNLYMVCFVLTTTICCIIVAVFHKGNLHEDQS